MLGAREAYRRGLDLRVLKRFRPTRSWVLEPGDMLYLPPDMAHRGVSLEDAFTYSIGFRGPSYAEVVACCAQRMVAASDPRRRYFDADLRRPPHEPGEITPAALQRLHDAFVFELARFDALPHAYERAFGELLTEPANPASAAAPPPQRTSRAAVRARIAAGATLGRSPASRVAFIRRADAADLFVDGRTLPLDRGLAFAAPLLTARRAIPAHELRPFARKGRFLDLVADLVTSGAFAFTAR